jgi:DNA (cytosine-5)-methyltransferase 1
LWFVKSRRAQNEDDYETWVRGGVSPTLNAFDNATETRATVIIIDGTRVGDVRVYEDQIMQTVIQRWGTGGGNVPMIFPIDDARELEKNQNGTGIGDDGAPAYTLDRQQAPGVAIAFHQKQNPINGEVSPALGTTTQGMGIATIIGTLQARDYKGLNHEGARDGKAIIGESSVVRRLTPTECERLQGFPDGWTEGQADSNRYKQMGNAVAVPVVQWIINRL